MTAVLPGAPKAGSRSQLRGSSLLLVGRVISMLITFVAQVVIVRYLSKTDFGALAYALSVVALVQSFLALGLDRADTRFMCLAEEDGDAPRFLGVLVLEVTTILSLGAAAVLAALVWAQAGEAEVVSLLLVLIALAPLQALDACVLNVFAVLARPRAVFVRRYILDPGLRLAVVALVVTAGGSVRAVATGYVLASIAGLAVYALLLVRLLRSTPLLKGARLLPDVRARELLSFSAPLLTSNVAFVSTTSFGAVLLGQLDGAVGVAEFRAVQPVAALNLMVMLSFSTMFTPMAARLYARSDIAGLREAYWLTSAWMAVLTLPVLLVTVALAGPVTTTLFGERYEQAAPVLAVLAIGYFLNGALGFNGTLLAVLGHLRFLVLCNLLTIAAAVISGVLLVQAWGALGAAVSSTSVLVLRNVMIQLGLRRRSGAGHFEGRYARVYIVVVSTAVLVTLVLQLLTLPLALGLGVVALASLLVVLTVRHDLHVGATLPELTRLPLLGRAFVP